MLLPFLAKGEDRRKRKSVLSQTHLLRIIIKIRQLLGIGANIFFPLSRQHLCWTTVTQFNPGGLAHCAISHTQQIFIASSRCVFTESITFAYSIYRSAQTCAQGGQLPIFTTISYPLFCVSGRAILLCVAPGF